MSAIEIVHSLVTSLTIAASVTILLQEKKGETPPAPTLPWVRRKAVEIFKEFVFDAPELRIADLGCGWGGMVMTLAKVYPSAHVDGYEITALPYIISKIRSLRYKSQTRIIYGSFFDTELTQYDAFFLYLPPKVTNRLKDILLKCKKGTVVVSASFPIEGWVPKRESVVTVGVRIPVYCYVIG